MTGSPGLDHLLAGPCRSGSAFQVGGGGHDSDKRLGGATRRAARSAQFLHHHAPPDTPPWTLIEAQLFGSAGDGGPFEALCTSYTDVIADQGGTALDANVACTWVQGLRSATFTVTVRGGGWAEAGVKLTAFQ